MLVAAVPRRWRVSRLVRIYGIQGGVFLTGSDAARFEWRAGIGAFSPGRGDSARNQRRDDDSSDLQQYAAWVPCVGREQREGVFGSGSYIFRRSWAHLCFSDKRRL